MLPSHPKLSMKVGKTKISIPFTQLPPEVQSFLQRTFLEQTQTDSGNVHPANFLIPTIQEKRKSTYEQLLEDCFNNIKQRDPSMIECEFTELVRQVGKPEDVQITRTIVKAKLTREFKIVDEITLEDVVKTETVNVVFNMLTSYDECFEDQSNKEFENVQTISKFNAETESFIPVLYYGRFEKTVYSVTPFCEYGALVEFLDNKRDELTPNIYFQIAFQVSRAVSFLASKNLIHADLHNGNILVKEYQKDTDAEFGNIQLVLIDFEYLSDCSESIDDLPTSLPSIPPDADISTEWDVWCFGQTLYQIITGEIVKFKELSEQQIRKKIFEHPKIRKSCLGRLIFCCLQITDRISAKCFLEVLICEWYSWLQYTKKLNHLLRSKKHPHHLIIRAIQATISGEFVDLDKLAELLPKDLRYIVDCVGFVMETKKEIPEELDCFLSHFFKALALEKQGSSNSQVEFAKCSVHFPKFVHVSDYQIAHNSQILSILDDSIQENESCFILRCNRAIKCLEFIIKNANTPNKKKLYETALKDLQFVTEFISFPVLQRIVLKLCAMLAEEQDDFGLNWIRLCKTLINSNESDVLKDAAKIFIKISNQSFAMSFLNKGIKINEDKVLALELLEWRAKLYFTQKNYSEAEKDFRQLSKLSIDANYVRYYGHCIFLQEKESAERANFSPSRAEEAIQLLSKYLISKPNDHSAIKEIVCLRLLLARNDTKPESVRRRHHLKLAAKDAIAIGFKEGLLVVGEIDPTVIAEVEEPAIDSFNDVQ